MERRTDGEMIHSLQRLALNAQQFMYAVIGKRFAKFDRAVPGGLQRPLVPRRHSLAAFLTRRSSK